MSATQQQVRQPRLKILIGQEGGQQQTLPVNVAISAEVTNNGFFQADSFRATLALNGDPAFGLAWIDGLAGSGETAAAIIVDVQISLDGGQSYTSLFVGEIDSMHPDLAQGTIEIQGRDLSRRFIDAKTQEAFKNKTGSQIATDLARKHGLTPVVTATSTLVGRYYEIDHDHVTMGQFSRTSTEWDLLTYLARQEGFVCYVKGRELHFEPAPTASSVPTLTVNWNNSTRTGNAIDLRLDRSLTLAKDVVVAVRSWDDRHAKGFTKYSPTSGQAAIKAGKAQQYVFTRPKLSEAKAQDLANRLRAEITAHERTISFRMPGDLTTAPHGVVALQGDVASWAQSYFVDNVSRNISFDGGFVQTVRAKNSSPDSQALVG